MFAARTRTMPPAARMVASAALIAWTSLIAKALGTGWGGDELHPLMISAGRFVFGLLALIPVILILRPSFVGTAWVLHAGRVLTGWGGVTLMFAATAFIPLADANAISFLAPVVTLALAVVVLRERIGRRLLPAMIALGGVLLLTRPGSDAFQPASLLALAAACSIGVEMTFIKRLSDSEPPLRILTISNGLGSVISVTVALFVVQVPSPQQLAALAFLGASMVSAQVLFVTSMQRADASALMPFLYLVPLFAALYDWLLYSQAVGIVSAVGIATTLTGAALLAAREREGTPSSIDVAPEAAGIASHPRPPGRTTGRGDSGI
ncbi:MAG: DMT family transporter [Acidimicrobiales bacterium]